MPMGFLGDEDPLYSQPEHECVRCCDIMIQDMFREWFCPTCIKNEEEEENDAPSN